MGEPGDRRAGHRFVERRHASTVDLALTAFARGREVGGAQRRRPATSPSSPRPHLSLPLPVTTPLLLARRIAATRMRGIRVRVNGSKVPYSLPCRSLLPFGRKRAVASITSANFGRSMARSRSIVPGCGGAGATGGARRRSATWESARTCSSMSSAQSVRATGVDAMHTSPFQWLNTMVADSGCHVARRYWSPPRTSARNTRFGGASATP